MKLQEGESRIFKEQPKREQKEFIKIRSFSGDSLQGFENNDDVQL